MRIPFTSDLRVGTDICRCDRIFNHTSPNLERTRRLASKFLTTDELKDTIKRFPWFQDLTAVPWLENAAAPSKLQLQGLGHFLAGRWAAKEAAKKAWTVELISMRDLRVIYSDVLHRPTIICNPYRKPGSIGKIDEQEGLLSISHDGDYAIATVLAHPLHSVLLEELKRKQGEVDAIFGTRRQQREESKASGTWSGYDRFDA